MRNQSVIISNLQGQLKSRVVCPQCHKESITFDPFLTLQVPLPVVNTRELPVITVLQQTVAQIAASNDANGAVDAEAHSPMAPAVWPLKSSGTIGQLKAELCESILAAPGAAGGSHPSLSSSPIHPSTLLFVEVYQHKIFKVRIDMRPARPLFLSLFSSLSFLFFFGPLLCDLQPVQPAPRPRRKQAPLAAFALMVTPCSDDLLLRQVPAKSAVERGLVLVG